tara:strand:+ start:376 stop:552 length:177 start_codon:yes stop_codon:yes gene_type:complete
MALHVKKYLLRFYILQQQVLEINSDYEESNSINSTITLSITIDGRRKNIEVLSLGIIQ